MLFLNQVYLYHKDQQLKSTNMFQNEESSMTLQNVSQSTDSLNLDHKTNEMTNQTAGASSQSISLKIKNQDAEEVFFTIKTTTLLKKMIGIYCHHKNINSKNVRFLFDGQRIHGNQTAASLNLENGDQIDAVVEQRGGKGY